MWNLYSRKCRIEIEICDNGDGTITITVLGVSQTEELPDGTSFEHFIAAFEATDGAQCEPS